MYEGNQGGDIWKKFIQDRSINTSELRIEVLKSWQRCKGKVDPYKTKNLKRLSPKEFEELRFKYRDLIDIGLPVAENFYKFVKDSGFSILLGAVENGRLIILEIIGDPEQLAMHERTNGFPGYNWSESVMGTTSAVLAAYHNKPFTVHPQETWCECLKEVSSSAAPIHDPDTSELIGILTVAASYTKIHPHTLGMVVAAVDSIEKQLAVRRLVRKSEIANHFKSVIMECFTDGLIAIDEYGSVIHVNHKALEILGLEKNPIGLNIFEVLNRTYGTNKRYQELASVINSEESVMDRFVNIRNSERVVRCLVSTRYLESSGESLGKILIIQQMSRTARLVNSALGNYAGYTFNDIIGQDQKFLDCVKIAIKVAKTFSNVLLLGESGTGKDLFAQGIHNASSRKDKPFFAINCAAIPRDLLGSELFGYVEGAFTGAKKGGSPGKFELADDGTIFLDEIGDMPIDMQSSLLRVLEEKAVTRVGDKGAIPVDVRVIAATNKDLSEEVKKGNFRVDLFYRINVVTIALPALRERIGDVPLLITCFVKLLSDRLGKKIDHIDPDVFRICSQYDWPGNIRELQNVIDRAVNLADSNVLSPDLLPETLYLPTAYRPLNLAQYKLKIIKNETENSTILACLEKHQGNMTLAAKELGIARSTLYRKVRNITCN